MKFEAQHAFFDTVYLKSDTAQLPRLVKSVQFLPGGVVNYELESAAVTSWHYEGSISRERIEFNIPAGFQKPNT